MSYILDALRRADAERSRGGVPSLHSQSLPPDPEPAARNHKPLIWGAGAAGGLLLAGVIVLLFGPWKSAPEPAADARPALTPELAPTRRDVAAASAPALPAQGELAAPQPGAIEPGARPVEPPISRATAPAAYPPPAQPQRPPVRDTLAERAAGGRVATLAPRAPAPTPAPVQPAVPVEHYGAPLPPPVATTGAHPNAVPNIKDLPTALQSQLPKLSVAGSVYSDTPSARMVILNGQVFHEGDKPATDTVLEQIRLKSAILNFRGQRYEISF